MHAAMHLLKNVHAPDQMHVAVFDQYNKQGENQMVFSLNFSG